jgi:fatty acyl-CoA reductase
MVPVDIVANSCIAAACVAGTRRQMRVSVFNCTSGGLNPISWGRVRDVAEPLLIKHPSMEIFRYPGSRFHAIKLLHQLNLFIEHTIPSQVVDFIFKITGHKPILAQVYQKVHRTINALEYFTTNEWTYRNSNQLSLTEEANEHDKERFYSDVRRIHWPTYMETYILGVRKFLLKEDPSTLPEARKRLQRIYYLILLGKVAAALTIAHQSYTHYPTAKKVWFNYLQPILKSPLTRGAITRT